MQLLQDDYNGFGHWLGLIIEDMDLDHFQGEVDKITNTLEKIRAVRGGVFRYKNISSALEVASEGGPGYYQGQFRHHPRDNSLDFRSDLRIRSVSSGGLNVGSWD